MQDNTSMLRLLKGKQSTWLPMLSGSMAPFLLPGDELHITPGTAKYKMGDIVVFLSHNKFSCHRVVGVFRIGKKTFLLEKGDANPTASFVSDVKILGKVTKRMRGKESVDLSSKEEKRDAKRKAYKSLLRLLTFGSLNYLKGRIKYCIRLISK